MLSNNLVFVLAPLLVAAVAAQNPCPADWRYSPFSNKCYKLFHELTSWTAAEYKCAFQGAHHIAIHDTADNQFVAELAKQAGIVWLGAVQFGTSRDYVWSDHTAYDGFENWEHGIRPSYHKGKKCSKFDGLTGTWRQSCCKVPAAYICQKHATVMPGIIEDDSALAGDDFRRARLAFRRN